MLHSEIEACYPLHKAIEDHNEIKALSILGQQPELAKLFDDHGCLPLHIAAMTNRTSLIQALLAVYPDAAKIPEDGGNGYTPVHIAAKNDHVETLKLLLQTKEGQEACLLKDASGATALGQVETPAVVETLIKACPQAMAIVNDDNLCPLRRILSIDGFGEYEEMAVRIMLRETPPNYLTMPQMPENHCACEIVARFKTTCLILEDPDHAYFDTMLNRAIKHCWIHLLQNALAKHAVPWNGDIAHALADPSMPTNVSSLCDAYLFPSTMNEERWRMLLSYLAYNSRYALFRPALKRAMGYNLSPATFGTVLEMAIEQGCDAATADLIRMGARLRVLSITLRPILQHIREWRRTAGEMLILVWETLGLEYIQQSWQSLPPPPKRSIRIARNRQALLNATTPPFIKIFVWGRDLASALIPFLGPQSTLALACTSLQCKALYSFDQRALAQCITQVGEHLLHRPTSTVVDTQSITI